MINFNMLGLAFRMIFGNPRKVRHLVFELTACKEHGYHSNMICNTNDEKLMIKILQEYLNILVLRNPE
jgi:hypothetical protein